MTCEQYRDLAAEVALGVAENDDRAMMLDHALTCAGCRWELKSFEDLADRLASLAPQAEPPAGFDAQVLQTMGLSQTEGARSSATKLRSRRARLLLSGVAAVLIGASAVGGFALGRSKPSGPAHPGGSASQLLTSEFMSGGKGMGQAIFSGGPDPWVAMSVDVEGGSGEWVVCQITLVGGKTISVGAFTLNKAGWGYWAAEVPPSDIRVAGAQLLDGSGKVIASAVWR